MQQNELKIKGFVFTRNNNGSISILTGDVVLNCQVHELILTHVDETMLTLGHIKGVFVLNLAAWHQEQLCDFLKPVLH
ncbi:hypothetical protein PSSHI_45330 [Photobacterium sp. R1]